MALPRQAVYPGTLEKAYRRELDNLVAGGSLHRLWTKDSSLWPADEDQKKSLDANLRWLDLPEQIGPYMAKVAEFANTLEADGFEDAVFVGASESSTSAEAVLQLSLPKRWKRLFVVDSTDPAAIRAVEKELNFQRAVFVLASKSGKGIEGHALFLYFLDQLKAHGIADPGSHFVAVTQEGSYLAEIAKQYKFRGAFFDPPGISGRYSALVHFGLLLSGLCRFAPANLLFHAASMGQLCRDGNLKDANPGLTLAAFLGAAGIEGNDRVLLFGSASLAALTHRVAQLVGVSTSKDGRGLVPITVETASALENYDQGCVAAIFHMRGDEDSALRQVTQQLRQAGVPCVTLELDAPEELGAEVFKWEIATALACAVLNVNPFEEPDLRESNSAAAEMLEFLARKRELPARTVRLREAGIELYAEGETRHDISTLSLAEALRTFLETRNPQGYIATLAFLDHSPKFLKTLRRIGEHLASKLRIPSLLSFGPRYLHHLGQVFHGGPRHGLFLMLTGHPTEDILIPGAGYSFGQLQLAMAMADFDVFTRQKRPILRLHLSHGTDGGLPQLEQVVQQSLRNLRAAPH